MDTKKIIYRFLWLVADAFVGSLIVYFSGISWMYAPLFIAVLQSITKEIKNHIEHMAITLE